MEALNSLPENGVPSELLTVETNESDSSSTVEPHLGPHGNDIDEDVVYNESTEMSSLLPVGQQQQ